MTRVERSDIAWVVGISRADRLVNPASLAGGIGLAMVGVTLLGNAAAADLPAVLPAGPDRMNYSVGYAFGRHLADLERQGQSVDLEMVFRGALDGLSEVSPRVPFEDMRSTLDELSGSASAGAQPSAASGRGQVSIRQRGFADDYAALNARREGVITLPSGVQYEVLAAGLGDQPKTGDTVSVRYKASLPSGVQFDSTGDGGEPASLAISEIAVPGLKDALLHMKVGDSWRVVIPSRLGFQRGQLLRRRDLIYEIELVSVVRPSADASAGSTESKPPAQVPNEQAESGQEPEG